MDDHSLFLARIVAQATGRPLRHGDPDQLVAIDDRQPDQLSGIGGQSVEHRLRNIRDARAAQKTQPHRGQADGQCIVALSLELPDIAQPGKLLKCAMDTACRLIELPGYSRNREAFGVIDQELDYGEGLFEDATHGNSVIETCSIRYAATAKVNGRRP